MIRAVMHIFSSPRILLEPHYARYPLSHAPCSQPFRATLLSYIFSSLASGLLLEIILIIRKNQ